MSGLDDLMDQVKEKGTEEDENEEKAPESTHNTEPSNDLLDETKDCPVCGTEGELDGDVYVCEFSWCLVDHFVSDEVTFYQKDTLMDKI